jgi:hypothetical protein
MATPHFQERCARCKRVAPEAKPGPGGQVAQGWTTYAGTEELVIGIPDTERTTLPEEIVQAIAEHEVSSRSILPRITLDPRFSRLFRTTGAWLAPTASARLARDHFEWMRFMATTNAD